MTIFKFALMRGFKGTLALVFNILLPIGVILFRPLWTDGDTGFFLLAFLFMNVAFIMSQSILKDKTDGSVIRILSAPVTLFNYLFQNMLACLVPMLIQTLLVGILGFAVYGWEVGFTLGIILTYTLFSMTSIAFSFAWHTLFTKSENSNAAFMTILTFLGFLGGLFIRLSYLPNVLFYSGALFPAHWISRSLDTLLSYGVTPHFWLFQFILVFFCGIFLLFGGKRKMI